jgi:hypothetical protein
MKMGTAMANVKGRHVGGFDQLHLYAWKIGTGLGMLDVMGEVPHHEKWGEPA